MFFLMEAAMWRKAPVRWTLAVMVVIAALSGERAATQGSPQSGNSLPNPFNSVENYLKLPNGRKLGAIVGIRFDRDGASVLCPAVDGRW